MPTLFLAIDASRARRGAAEFDRSAGRVERSARGASRRVGSLEGRMTSAGRAAGLLRSQFAPLVGTFAAFLGARAAVRTLVDFEQGLVGVQKTTNATNSEIEALGESILGLSTDTPVTAERLLEVAQAAGQLGVRGNPAILSFAETIAKLETATDLAGEEAALTLARLLTIAGEAPETVDVLGSVITRLGNNFAATESEIAGVARRVSQGTAQFEVSSAEAAALGAALTSVGQNAELAGTAIGRTFQSLDAAIRGGGRELEVLSQLTGQTGEELQEAFGEDPIRVFQRFVEGLGEVNESGGSVADVISQLGIEGIRTIQVLAPLAANTDVLAGALDEAADEVRNVNALNEEAARAYDTLGSEIDRSGNVLRALVLEFRDANGPAKDFLGTVNDGVSVVLGLRSVLDEDLSPAARDLAVRLQSLGIVAEVTFDIIDEAADDVSGALGDLLSETAGENFLRDAANNAIAFATIAGSGLRELIEDTQRLQDLFDQLTGRETSRGRLGDFLADDAEFATASLGQIEELKERAREELAEFEDPGFFGINVASTARIEGLQAFIDASVSEIQAAQSDIIRESRTGAGDFGAELQATLREALGRDFVGEFAGVFEALRGQAEAELLEGSLDVDPDALFPTPPEGGADAAERFAAALGEVAAGSEVLSERASDGLESLLEMQEALEREIALVGRSADEKERLEVVEQALNAAREAGVEDLEAVAEAAGTLFDRLQRLRDQEKENEEANRALQDSADDIASSFGDAFGDVVTGSADAEDAVRSFAQSALRELLELLAIQPLVQGLSAGIAGGLGGLDLGGGGAPTARGALVQGGRRVPMQRGGGLLDGPTLLPFSGGSILAGEKSPGELLVPAERDSRGRISVNVSEVPRNNVTIINNISTPSDDSFRRSQRQREGEERRRMQRIMGG